ncbi:ubiquinone biosynthesis protein COQ6, mitochondrial [Arctopsyche grandis]|uniref:ubiquinone biosynthesis protein COQ6, mitochondrial n=1 Tax=Arctopsyche grandis TaxID=121162 RepID=UPI00406D9D61
MWFLVRSAAIRAMAIRGCAPVRPLTSGVPIHTNSHSETPDYDIIIAGGGMVGCTLACALAKNTKLSSQKILLLESSPEKKFTLTDRYSNRVSALNPTTKNLMISIGAWKHIEKMRLQPVKNMQVWDACSEAMITFNHDNLQKDVAYIVENDVLLYAVNEELNSADNCNQIEIIHNSKITDYELPGLRQGVQNSLVKMDNGETYSCKLLLGADGANSKVRQTMGTQYVSWSYNQMGIVATLKLTDSTDNTTAWQRFLPTGPIAILPLNSNHSSLVWSTSPQEAKSLLKMSDEEFVQTLNHALHKQYPRNTVVDSAVNALSSFLSAAFLPSGITRQLPPSIENVAESSRAAFPLGFGHSVRYVSKGVALVGDAAHRVHPLAGQGVNLGFSDISCLVDILSNAVYSGSDIGDKSHLLNYETQRQRHVVPTSAAIDALHKLYTTDATPIVLLRSLGLQVTHAVNPVKKLIMSHAMA